MCIDFINELYVSIQGFPGCLRDNHALNKIILVLLKDERISRACSDDNDACCFFFKKRLFRWIIENKITQVRNQLIKNLNIFLQVLLHHSKCFFFWDIFARWPHLGNGEGMKVYYVEGLKESLVYHGRIVCKNTPT